MSAPPFSAILLVAGHSTRMGRDKALLEFAGAPLWRHQRDLLARAGAAEIFLSARPDQSWTRTASGFTAVLHDAFPDCGPLGGLTAALERATHPHLAVLAIDLPRMTPEWFTALLAGCAPGIGLVAQHTAEKKFFEPLAAIYPCEALPLAQAALARGDYSLQKFLAAAVAQGCMRVREISVGESSLFGNWNEPASHG